MNRRHFLGTALALASIPLAGLLPTSRKLSQPDIAHYDHLLLATDLPNVMRGTLGREHSGYEVEQILQFAKDNFGFDLFPWQEKILAPSIGHHVTYNTKVLSENWLIATDPMEGTFALDYNDRLPGGAPRLYTKVGGDWVADALQAQAVAVAEEMTNGQT